MKFLKCAVLLLMFGGFALTVQAQSKTVEENDKQTEIKSDNANQKKIDVQVLSNPSRKFINTKMATVKPGLKLKPITAFKKQSLQNNLKPKSKALKKE